MNKEKEIEEMVERMKAARKECGESSCKECDCSKYGAFCQFAKYAQVAICKADEVRKETAKEILQHMHDNLPDLKLVVKFYEEKYGVEVDE